MSEIRRGRDGTHFTGEIGVRCSNAETKQPGCVQHCEFSRGRRVTAVDLMANVGVDGLRFAADAFKIRHSQGTLAPVGAGRSLAWCAVIIDRVNQ